MGRKHKCVVLVLLVKAKAELQFFVAQTGVLLQSCQTCQYFSIFLHHMFKTIHLKLKVLKAKSEIFVVHKNIPDHSKVGSSVVWWF